MGKVFSSMNSEVENLYNNMLCCSASRQMLVYHAEYSPDPTNNPYRTEFLQNLNSLGYPENLRKIAIANGAGNAFGQLKDDNTPFNPTDQIVNWHYYNWWTLDLDGNSWAVPNYSPKTTIFYGKIDMTWLAHIAKWDFHDHILTSTMENSKPYDNAPGGCNPTAKIIADSDTDGYGDITTDISNHCFIPTVSSLSINTSNLFYNISTDPNILLKTPFDMIYYPTNTNQEHAHISQECVSWIMGELVPQHFVLDGINDSWNKGEVHSLIIILCEFLHKRGVTVEYTRKLAHTLAILSCLFVTSCLSSHWYVLGLIMITFSILYIILDTGSIYLFLSTL